MTLRRAAARALANVALVKYFGKRDTAQNLPAAGSLSVALAMAPGLLLMLIGAILL